MERIVNPANKSSEYGPVFLNKHSNILFNQFTTTLDLTVEIMGIPITDR